MQCSFFKSYKELAACVILYVVAVYKKIRGRIQKNYIKKIIIYLSRIESIHSFIFSILSFSICFIVEIMPVCH